MAQFVTGPYFKDRVVWLGRPGAMPDVHHHHHAQLDRDALRMDVLLARADVVLAAPVLSPASLREGLYGPLLCPAGVGPGPWRSLLGLPLVIEPGMRDGERALRGARERYEQNWWGAHNTSAVVRRHRG